MHIPNTSSKRGLILFSPSRSFWICPDTKFISPVTKIHSLQQIMVFFIFLLYYHRLYFTIRLFPVPAQRASILIVIKYSNDLIGFTFSPLSSLLLFCSYYGNFLHKPLSGHGTLFPQNFSMASQIKGVVPSTWLFMALWLSPGSPLCLQCSLSSQASFIQQLNFHYCMYLLFVHCFHI
jgi:hypothetical protein